MIDECCPAYVPYADLDMDSTLNAPTRILVVDDHPDNLDLLEALLGRQNYEVSRAENGMAALQQVAAFPPDLILLDIMMPDMDGYAVCTTLKSDPKTCMIPVIFISALTDAADKVKAFQVGGMDYITKPFQIWRPKIQRSKLKSKLGKKLNLSFDKNAIDSNRPWAISTVPRCR
jgi:PleD family two-component response regulator